MVRVSTAESTVARTASHYLFHIDYHRYNASSISHMHYAFIAPIPFPIRPRSKTTVQERAYGNFVLFISYFQHTSLCVCVWGGGGPYEPVSGRCRD